MKWAVLLGMLASVQMVQAQGCNAFMKASNVVAQYVAVGDGTVVDAVNGITWKVCSEGQTYDQDTGACRGAATHFERWQDALNQSNGEYRLPNIKELSTLVERSCAEPALLLSVFPDTPISALYWSNTPDSAIAGPVGRFIDFTDGSEILRDANRPRHVRMVKID